MMVYASIVLPTSADPTPTQERKFLGSVVLPDEELRARMEKIEKVRLFSDPYIKKAVVALSRVLKRSGWTPDTTDVPPVWEYMGRRYGTEKEDVAKIEYHLATFLGREEFYPFHCQPAVVNTLGEVGEDQFDLTHPWNGRWLNPLEVEPSDGPIGVIGFSQEPGAKLRAFASPNWVLQAAMEGTKQCLLRALAGLPWDCTHDQHKGVQGVQRWLREGHKVFSVDLSDATNNFPLELQLKVLRFLGLPTEDVRLLELVSRSGFSLAWGDKRCVKWSVGQPLGAGPSFMAFALGHATIALAAEIKAGVPEDDRGGSFFILGDDVVFRDERAHDAYRGYLDSLSCPVSETKCLQSTVAGEFAGKLITVDHVYHGYKYREISDLSFLDVIRNLGSKAITLLTPLQRAYAELVWELPEPQGLGFNPLGRSAAERWYEFEHVVEALEQAEPDTNMYRPS